LLVCLMLLLVALGLLLVAGHPETCLCH